MTLANIGVDVGGTHTDVCVTLNERIFRGKSLTDYEDFGRGVVAAIAVAAENGGFKLEELLGQTQLLINGTTVVTNSITEGRGSRVGVLVTKGFKDTFRLSGGPRIPEFDDHLQVNPTSLVSRHDIVEIEERIDFDGKVLVPLNESEIRQAAQELIDSGVSAIAICFISSYANPEHETQAAKIVESLDATIYVICSNKAFPVRGENRRWTTALLNAFVHDRARLYINSMNSQLRSAGFSGALAFFQGLGGGISSERVLERPLMLLGSGPAGGAIGANELAKTMGLSAVLVGDMGGTSFDTGIITDNEIHIEKNLQLGQLETGVNIVDVVSIGAGGGSIAFIDERGVPQVGPLSATSHPGPACYGHGGDKPTVTDAMVYMGFIDPDRYLGGRVELRTDLAAQALSENIAKPFNWTIEEAAAAVHDLVVVNMATAVREVTVEKGHDPRDFMFLAYGGTLPLFAAQIAKRLGIQKIVIPNNSSVFCAQGLLSADYMRRYDRTVQWDLDQQGGEQGVNLVIKELRTLGIHEMKDEGFAEDQIAVSINADFRFSGQYYELSVPIPNRDITFEDTPELIEKFRELYERTYGVGTAWKNVSTQMLNISITINGGRDKLQLKKIKLNPTPPDQILRSMRKLYLPDVQEFREVAIYDDGKFTAGSSIEGPAIIDITDTTIYVPIGVTAHRDEYMNYVLTQAGDI
jgi:N-methylhydantoinase A